MTGFVYLAYITNTHAELHKIGMTTNLKRRQRELSSEFCTPVEVVDWIEVDDMQGVEAWLHTFFSDCRCDGELFMLSEKRVELWAKLAGMIERIGLKRMVSATEPATR